MKKVTALFVASLLFVSVAHAQTAFNTNLYYGITNNSDVQALQEFLTVQGDYSGPITGNYYSLTLAGVKKFQSANSLPTTGYFGVLSRGIANKMLTSEQPTPPVAEVGTTTPPVVPTPAPTTQTVQPGCRLQYYGTFNGFPQYFPYCPPAEQRVVPQTTTPSPSSSNGSDTQTNTAPVQIQAQVAPVIPAPTCTLSATTTMDAAYWINTYGSNPPKDRQPVQFSWSFPSGATAVLTGGGQTIAIPTSYYNGPSIAQAMPKNISVNSHPFSQTYTLTVTKDGQTGTCSAEATSN